MRFELYSRSLIHIAFYKSYKDEVQELRFKQLSFQKL